MDAKYSLIREKTQSLLAEAGLVIRDDEWDALEFAEFGLGEIEKEGLQIIVYENNDRYCAKELILLPNQTCPEHYHPPVEGQAGKRETFRCRWGKVNLYVSGPGEPDDIQATIPEGSREHYTVFHEVVMNPGDQYTLEPGTRHWFQGGDEGGIVSEFSSTSRDIADVYTDPRIVRVSEMTRG